MIFRRQSKAQPQAPEQPQPLIGRHQAQRETTPVVTTPAVPASDQADHIRREAAKESRRRATGERFVVTHEIGNTSREAIVRDIANSLEYWTEAGATVGFQLDDSAGLSRNEFAFRAI